MAEIKKKPVGIMETVLRDAHQSLIATRMTTEQMLPIIDKMDKVGYHAVECWGGATFYVSCMKIHGRDFANCVTDLKIQNCRCCSADRTFWDIVLTQMMW